MSSTPDPLLASSTSARCSRWRTAAFGYRSGAPRQVEAREGAAVDDVSFTVGRGETLGLVGESGSGKSVTALSIIRLVLPPGRIAGGRIELDGRNLLDLDETAMRAIRGRRIGFIFQEPMVALDPVYTIGYADRGDARRARPRARSRPRAGATIELLEARARSRIRRGAPASIRISSAAASDSAR